MSRSSRPSCLIAITLSAILSGCGATQTQAPGLPPTPQSVTKDSPGGDAHDPHLAALTRLSEAQWGWRPDKDQQARFPLPDYDKWTRIRFSLIDHFTGFRYGEDPHAFTAAFTIDLEGDEAETTKNCRKRFEQHAWKKVRTFGGRLQPVETISQTWKGKPLEVRTSLGEVSFLFQHYRAALAWAAYPAYPKSCMVYVVVVLHEEGDDDLARQARDRFAQEGLRYFHAMTPEKPFRR